MMSALLFTTYNAFWRTLSKYFRPSTPSCVFKGQVFQDGDECAKTSDSHEHEPTATLLWLSDDFLVQKKCSIEYMTVHNAFCKPKET